MIPHEKQTCPHPFLFAKGDLKMFVLHALEQRPMHGYELMKHLGEQHGGVYKPSAGAIYPTLRRLRNRGFVSAREIDGRKTYTITRAGKRYLESRRREFRDRLKAFEASIGPEKAVLMREARSVGKLLARSVRELTPEQADRLAVIMAEVHDRIVDIIGERE